MNEDNRVSDEEFAHENEHIEESRGFPQPFEALAWILLFLIAGYWFVSIVF